MSSTSTMSSSDDRPMMISRWGRSGNSPPWYLPEMKRSAHCALSVPLAAAVGHVARPKGAQNLAILRCRPACASTGGVGAGRISATTSATSASTSSPEWPVGSAMCRTPSSTVRRQRRQPVADRADRDDLGARRQRPLGQLAQERAAGKQLQAGQPERRGHEAEQRRPGPLRRRPQHDQPPHPVPPAQALQVVEPDQAAHRVADDVDLARRRSARRSTRPCARSGRPSRGCRPGSPARAGSS